MKQPKTFFQAFLLLTLLMVAGGTFTSCVKQKNCEHGCNGYFIYLENPYQVKHNGEKYTIKAMFVPEQSNLDMDSLLPLLIQTNSLPAHRELVYYIYGSIPQKFRESTDMAIPVNCSLQGFYKYHSYPQLYDKIHCIECL